MRRVTQTVRQSETESEPISSTNSVRIMAKCAAAITFASADAQISSSSHRWSLSRLRAILASSSASNRDCSSTSQQQQHLSAALTTVRICSNARGQTAVTALIMYHCQHQYKSMGRATGSTNCEACGEPQWAPSVRHGESHREHQL